MKGIIVGILLAAILGCTMLLQGCTVNYVRVYNSNGASCSVDIKTEELNMLEPSSSIPTPFLK